MSEKRNRSGNFDQDDVELFLSLVNENKTLIESGKQEDKHKGWTLIHEGFNDTCTGIKRDVAALKMKLKNLKAQNKKFKSSNETSLEPMDEESEQDTSGIISIERKPQLTRKRGRIFTTEECSLLQDLVEKHFHPLDTSLTRASLDQRNKAWDTVTEEFNSAQLGIQRDLMELKIKHKNMKAQRQNFKSEAETGATSVMNSYGEEYLLNEDPSPERKLRSKPLNEQIASNSIKVASTAPRLLRPNRVSAVRPKRKVFDEFLDELDVNFDSDSEDEYVPPVRNQPHSTSRSEYDKESERIRKENLLLKNAVLRKKERLLELQIALAERNLRRHQL